MEYKNSLRSKKLIREACIELLNKKDNISEITISEVVNLAGISRGTFYNHYNNLSEVGDEIRDELLRTISLTLKDTASKDEIDNFIDTLIEYFKENEMLYKRLTKIVTRPVMDGVKIRFLELIKNIRTGLDKPTTLILINGLAGTYLDYLEGRADTSLDDFAKSAKNMLHKLAEN